MIPFNRRTIQSITGLEIEAVCADLCTIYPVRKRPKGEVSFFVERRQDGYRINPNSHLTVDTDLFITNVEHANPPALKKALLLYQGRYFEDSPVQEWLTVDVQYFHQQFLFAADKLSTHFIEQQAYEEALEVIHQVLAIDKLWEPAYRYQMQIFNGLGRPSMIRKVFRQCQNAFREELNISLSPDTISLYDSLLSND